VNDFRYVHTILPGDLASWTRNDGKTSADRPFIAYCNGVANAYWTDIGGATSGCHRNIEHKRRQLRVLSSGDTGKRVDSGSERAMAFKVTTRSRESKIMDTAKNTGSIVPATGRGVHHQGNDPARRAAE